MLDASPGPTGCDTRVANMLTLQQAATSLPLTSETTSKALTWYGRAAERGDVRAQRAIGDTYHHGWGVPVDRAEAVKWYRLAAERGDVKAQKRLASIYSFDGGSPEDQVEAVEWYRLAAEQGDAGARRSLGLKYLQGQGVRRDYVLAYMWFSLAASADRHESAPDYGATWGCHLAAKQMTPEQIAKAQRMASEWRPKTQP